MQGVLFDLDGTLINSLDDLAFAMNRALKIHGLATYPVQDYRYFVGNGIKILTKRVCGAHPEKIEDVQATYEAYYSEHWMDRSHPYEGIEEMLQAMKAQGLKLCVFSNKPHRDTCHVVEHFFGSEFFDRVQGQLETIPIKPDPTGAQQLARELGILTENMLYLGDSGVDMVCARRAGMHGCGALWGFREREELMENGAEWLAKTPMDVLKYCMKK